MANARHGKSTFRGFRSPTYTQVPDELFDELLPELSGAELKVLLYIIRRTFGFKRDSDSISLSQMLNGVQSRNGGVLDRGAGVSKPTLLQALRSLEERGIITTERRRSAEKGDEPTVYTLRFADDPEPDQKRIPPVVNKFDQGGGKESLPPGWSKNLTTQETVTQQTDFDHSNFEKSHDDVDTSEPSHQGQGLSEAIGTAQRLGAGRGESQLVPPGDVARLRTAAATTIGGRRTATPAPETTVDPLGRGRPAGTSEERELLAAYLGHFVTQLGDEAPLSSTVTRTLKILKQANIPMSRWPDLLYEAKSITWEHSAQIKKKPSDPSKTASARVRIPYYLAVLEQLVGLRPAPPSSPTVPNGSVG